MESAILLIGERAGKVWRALDETYELTLEQLVEQVDGDLFEVATAIGWLAREGKIFYRKREGIYTFSIRPNVDFFHFG